MADEEQMQFTTDYAQNIRMVDNALRVADSFDLIARTLTVGGRPATLYLVDGFAKDDLMEKIMQYIMALDAPAMEDRRTPEAFADRFIPYVEVDCNRSLSSLLTQVLSGTLALLIEGYDAAIMIDARTYPARSVSEPEDDRVLRGSRDGFVETLIFNTAMVRRRIRDPRLTMDIVQIGSVSKTDVVLCYMQGRVNERELKTLKDKIAAITIPTLTMGQESLAECLLKKQWYNPFPKIRYTERPDCAAASVLEGRILVIVDNSPAVMILPTAIFDFVQDTNDYYFPPLVGSYLRLVRGLIFAFTLFLTPVWYLLIKNPAIIPEWLRFIQIAEPNTVPILLQLLAIEFIIDGVKLASLNTPSALSNAFGIVGALILGEFAVSAGLFVPEVLLYMAFVAISTFTQPSFELGYAFKLFRMLFLVLTALLDIWGFVAGLVLMIVMLVTTRTVTGSRYLYPLFPFNGKAFLRLLFRRRISHDNT